MLKQRKIFFVPTIILAVFIAVYIQSIGFRDDYTIRTQSIIVDVLNNVEKVRGLKPPRQVDLKVVDVNWSMENWGKKYVEALSGEIKSREKVYKLLWLMNENTSLGEILIRETGMYIAAAFQGSIYVVRENFNPYDRVEAEKIICHEVTHMLQSMYFKEPVRKTHDGKQAWSTLIEGDAIFTADKFVEAVRRKTQMEKSSFNHWMQLSVEENGKEDLFQVIPEPLHKIWLFPYTYGRKFIPKLYEMGGWRRVNEAYEKPPLTTEQIIHMEKYFSYEGFREVKVPGIEIPGLNRKLSDRMGEHFIHVFLSNWINENESSIASEGWNGDNLTFFVFNGNNYILLWRIAWDSGGDREEFGKAFMDMMNVTGAETVSNCLWERKGEFICLREDENESLIIFTSKKEVIHLIE